VLRWVIAVLLAPIVIGVASAPARADAPGETAPAAPVAAEAAATATPDVADREIGAQLGVAMGGHTTPGGLRLGGRFLYQMSDIDWFEGLVAFTFGGSGAVCFRDRSDVFTCDHGALDGFSSDLAIGIRRFFGGQQGFRPYARVTAGVRLLRFGGDQVTGFGIPVTAGAGVRVRLTDEVAVGGEASLELGPSWLGHGLGAELQRGLAVGATVEIALP
jgi:hypothetical protein